MNNSNFFFFKKKKFIDGIALMLCEADDMEITVPKECYIFDVKGCKKKLGKDSRLLPIFLQHADKARGVCETRKLIDIAKLYRSLFQEIRTRTDELSRTLASTYQKAVLIERSTTKIEQNGDRVVQTLHMVQAQGSEINKMLGMATGAMNNITGIL